MSRPDGAIVQAKYASKVSFAPASTGISVFEQVMYLRLICLGQMAAVLNLLVLWKFEFICIVLLTGHVLSINLLPNDDQMYPADNPWQASAPAKPKAHIQCMCCSHCRHLVAKP